MQRRVFFCFFRTFSLRKMGIYMIQLATQQLLQKEAAPIREGELIGLRKKGLMQHLHIVATACRLMHICAPSQHSSFEALPPTCCDTYCVLLMLPCFKLLTEVKTKLFRSRHIQNGLQIHLVIFGIRRLNGPGPCDCGRLKRGFATGGIAILPLAHWLTQ